MEGLNCESQGDFLEIVLGGACALVPGFFDDSEDWFATELYRIWNFPEFRHLGLQSVVMTHMCLQRNRIKELVQLFLHDRLRFVLALARVGWRFSRWLAVQGHGIQLTLHTVSSGFHHHC